MALFSKMLRCEKMRRILLTIAYDGTAYSGFQAQKTGVQTIEGELNKALENLTGVPVEVSGASRTDAGVHALCNLAVFDTDSPIPAQKFSAALNVRLPADIRVQDSCEVPHDFHPRFCSTVKTYEYVIYNAPFPSPRRRLYSFFSYTSYDVERMREAGRYLTGEHDFRSFCSVNTQALTTIRTITQLDVEEYPCRQEAGAFTVSEALLPVTDDFKMEAVPLVGGSSSRSSGSGNVLAKVKSGIIPREIVIRVSGTGFLYNMVRIIAGTLMEVGRGKMEPGHMAEILAACDRRAAGPTAPPEGLTLVRYQIL